MGFWIHNRLTHASPSYEGIRDVHASRDLIGTLGPHECMITRVYTGSQSARIQVYIVVPEVSGTINFHLFSSFNMAFSRRSWAILSSFLPLLVVPTLAETSIYSACQAATADPLEGCPSNTLLVSQTDCRAKFTTIQSAILSIPDNSTNYTILVLPGIYVEQLNITRSAPLTIFGQTATPNEQSDNTVTVYWASANSNSRYSDNAFTSVLTVAPNLNASLTGSGPTGYPVPADTPFGCIDFRVYNIDFRNIFSEISVGPSLAVSVSRANAGFYFSGFYSYQDTVSQFPGVY